MTFLSLEQQNVANAYVDKKTITSKYIDKTTAYKLAIKLALDKITSSEPVVFLSRLKEKKEEIYSILEDVNLKHLAYETFSFSPIADADISRIRTLVNTHLDLDRITEYEITVNRIEQLTEQLNTQYHQLTDSIYGNSTVDDIIHLQNRYNPDIPVITFDLDSFKPEAYHQLKAEIKKFMTSEFDLYDAIKDSLPLNIDQEERTQEEYESLIGEFLDRFRDLHLSFSNEKKAIEYDLFMKSENAISEVEEILAAAKVEILKKKISLSTDNSGGFKLPFFAKSGADMPYASILEEVVNRTSSKINIDVLVIREHAGDYELARLFLDDLTGKLRKQSIKEKMLNKATLARINKLNTENYKVRELDEELNIAIQELNASGIFKVSYENNAFSFIRQIDSIGDVISQLSRVHKILKAIPDYILWSRSLSGKRELNEILSHLKMFPQQDWVRIFEKSFIANMVDGQVKDLPVTSVELDELHENYNRLNDLHSYYIDFILLHKRLEAINHLKKHKKDIYNSIFKKKLPCKMTYAELFQAAPDFVNAFFPLQFALRNENLPAYYTGIYNFNEGEGSVVDAINFTAFAEDDFNEVLPAHVLPLYLNDYNYTDPLADLPNLQKLRASKKLAKLLLSISQNINMYQLKNANVISLLPYKDDTVVSSIMEHAGAKKLDVQNLYNRLTESILETERKQYLLIKNGLIDDQKGIFPWQKYVLDLFLKSGFNIHTLWTADFVNNPVNYESFLQDIVGGEKISVQEEVEVLEEIDE